ncbi:MAG TPA: terminase family protein, partial [Erysipelothrix sp.]|nr:terminase family protein [Erysipelothrix sp.]
MLKQIFDDDTIEHLKTNKDQISPELLEKMRSFGNEGKRLALEILDTEKDHEGYYVDSFGNRLSFNGNRGIKGQFAKMDLANIHVEEIKRCAEDIHYFKDNYIRIRTKNGINFPEMREYQNEFITIIEDDVNEDIIGLSPRQSGKSVTVGIYLAHLYNFSQDRNIGIAANRSAMAREFLNNVKNMVLELPMWMQLGTIVWNKGSIENEAGMRILTDVPSSDSFRGYSIHCLVIDETAFIRNTVWDEFTDSIFPSQSGLAWKKTIMISTANGMNHFYHLVEDAKSESNGMQFYQVSWKDVPRYKADGSVYSPEEFMNSIIRKHGEVYWAQNYENSFIGSSYTLLSADALKKIKPKDPEMIQDQLKIYEFPEKN